MEPSIEKTLESLSPNERKILQLLGEKDINEICKKSNLDKISVIRSLEYLKSKKIIEISTEKKKIIEIGVNGALYKKKGLPDLSEAQTLSYLEIVPQKVQFQVCFQILFAYEMQYTNNI